MRRVFLLCLFFVMLAAFSSIAAQPSRLSDSAKVSLLTCDPGEELYAKFGHSAIRIQDPVNQFDWVFHYGVFDFNTSHFYWKFVRGKTDYLMGVNNTQDFLIEYHIRESGVTEQVLDLTKDEINLLFNNLIINNLPENREYRYNFVFDNCATRPRDQILTSTVNKLIFHSGKQDLTFRQLISQYLNDDPWANFGICLIFGQEADRVATGYESQFLPLVMKSQMDKAGILDSVGKPERKLVKSTHLIVEGKSEEAAAGSFLTHPFFYAVVFMLIGIWLSSVKNKKSFPSKFYDTIWLVLSGIAGLLIVFLTLFSDHPMVGNNINLLWLNPFNLIVAWLLWKHRFRKPLFFYYLLNVILIVVFILMVAMQKQSVPFEVIPLSGIVLLRFARRAVRNGKRIIIKTTTGYKWK